MITEWWLQRKKKKWGELFQQWKMTGTFCCSSHIYKKQLCAHTNHSECQILKAELTFTRLGQRYKQIHSSCCCPAHPLHLPQENCECFSQDNSSQSWTQGWAREPQTPKIHFSQTLLGFPFPSADVWRAPVPQEALRLLVLGQDKSQNKTASDCQLRTRPDCRRNGNNSL